MLSMKSVNIEQAVLDDFTNKRADYGNGDFDTRHLFTLNFTYDVPKAAWATSAWADRLVNGWQVSSIMNFHSGQPYDELLSGLNFLGGSATTGSTSSIRASRACSG